jgi:hypothetical protein
MIRGAIFNALSFSGSSYLFNKLDKKGYEAEIKRHNLAMEKLRKNTSEWEKHRSQTIDFVNLQLKKENEAALQLKNVDNALTLYNELHPLNKQIILNNPQLSDYYTSSTS